jgi:predicted ATPase
LDLRAFRAREEGDASGLELILYEDTDHFQIKRNFLNRRQTFLDILWSED